MPTQPPSRPFFASFFSAFRARTVPGSQASSMKPASSQNTSISSTSSTSQATASPSTPRNIGTTAKTGATTSALSQIHSPPLSRSPGTSPGYLTSQREAGISAPTHNGSAARRRGSDSSSEGANWRETMGAEKWYVGGRTAAGEERYFKMGVVRRDKSLDRLSSDRLSL